MFSAFVGCEDKGYIHDNQVEKSSTGGAQLLQLFRTAKLIQLDKEKNVAATCGKSACMRALHALQY